MPRCAQLVDHVLDRAEHRSEGHHHGVGIVDAVAVTRPPEPRPNASANSSASSSMRTRACSCRAWAMKRTSSKASGPTMAPMETGSSGSSTLPRFEGRQVRVDLLLCGQVHAFDGVGEDETVHAHHDRERELLGQTERLDMEVSRLLVGLGEQHDPAGVADGHGIAVVVPDVDRCADGAVGERHHDGQAEARRRCRRPPS